MGMLDGKAALVTGAGRGIGRGIALALAQAGAKVVVNDLGTSLDGEGKETPPADQVVDEILTQWRHGRHQLAAPWPTSSRPTAMVEQAIDAFGRIDILVNVAGILRDRMIFNMTEAEWDAVIAVHLKGTFNCTRAASIRCASSRAAASSACRRCRRSARPGQPNYAAAKAGIIGLTWSTRQRAGEVRRDRQRDHAERRDAHDRLDAARPGGLRADRQVAERAWP